MVLVNRPILRLSGLSNVHLKKSFSVLAAAAKTNDLPIDKKQNTSKLNSYRTWVHSLIGVRYASENVTKTPVTEDISSVANSVSQTVGNGLEDPSFTSINFGEWSPLGVLQDFSHIIASLSDSTPVRIVQNALLQIHDYSGLPWWATIVVSTVAFRTIVTLPLAIYSTKITAKVENLTLEMPAIVKELKAETAFGMKKYKWTEKQARILYNRSLKKQWNNLIVRDNCHPAKTLIVLWGQIPLWIFQSVAIRNLVYMQPDPSSVQAQIAFTELTVGGFGWIPNLVDIDHSFILPVALGVINLFIIQMQVWMRVTKSSSRLQKVATNFFRLISVGMIPISCTVPSVLCIYWVSSSAYGLLQNLILVSPTFRRKVGIPKTNSELAAPYSHLFNVITSKVSFRNEK